jgi:hypothetical protein
MSVGVVAAGATRLHTGLELGKQVRHPWFVQHREIGIAISSGRNSGTFAEGIAIVQCAMRNKMHCAEADSCRYGRHP